MSTTLRAVARSLPLLRRGSGLPAATLTRSVVVDGDHVAAYARACGFSPRARVPATYPHVLSFPLLVGLLAEPDGGVPLLGLVHLENAMTLHRPVWVGERLVVSARAEALRPHRRGRAFDVVTEARTGAVLVWSGRSTYLHRGPGEETAARGAAYDEVTPGGVPWRVPGNLGRRYAAVSGDHNPIHLSVPTARLFGFRRPIAHGMWSAARCVAALENRLPETVTVEVSFRKPVLLPATVFLGETEHRGGLDFGLFDAGGRPHLLGRVGPVSPVGG